MSISSIAKRKALDFAERVYKISNPQTNTSPGSAIRSLILLPFSMIYSAVFDETEAIRNMHLGNYSSISEHEMDLLANNMMIKRPEGSRSNTTLRVYLREAQPITLESYPYFSSVSGVKFMPVRRMSFGIEDILDDNGEMYINVPVISSVYGPVSIAEAGEIQGFEALPGVVSRVTNPTPTVGGRGRMSNAEFYEYIKNTLSSGSTSQENGLKKFVYDNYPEVMDMKIVGPRDPEMTRDEFWTEDSINPNLLRLGEPYAKHTDLGVLKFNHTFGRAYSEDGLFTRQMIGERVSISGDFERFRTILDVVNSNEAILSGDPIEGGEFSAKVWGRGPKRGGMSDVYVYFPSVEIQSVVIDKREQTELINVNHPSRLYYRSNDINFNSGTVVYQPGSDDEDFFVLTSRGRDENGYFLQLDSDHNLSVEDGDTIFVYDMNEIIVGEDMVNTPVIYILSVEKLDPLTFDTVDIIPQTSRGNYSPPGWYLSVDDSSEIFSPRETKRIILDEKSDSVAYGPIHLSEAVVVGPGIVDAGDHGLEGVEGRRVTIEDISTQTTIETVILYIDRNYILFEYSGLENANLVNIYADAVSTRFSSNPVRIVYATNSDIRRMQDSINGDLDRILCDDTLVRSMLPSIIDAEIHFRGGSSSKDMHASFVNLLHRAVREVDGGSRIRLDMSNIITALSDEGLTDSIDVNFEVKVTNYLSDGRSVVRYLNPSESTKQKMALEEDIHPAESIIRVRRLDSKAPIPGRGKLFLGGNNPDRQEVVPYEAVIETGDGLYNLIPRKGWRNKYPHFGWSTVYVTARDYDPELEFNEGAIFIPAENRPYIRNLVVVKE